MNAKAWKWVQLGLTIAWVVLLVPSMLWWAQSIRWVVAMSAWALVAGHAAGWMAARGEENAVDKSDLEPLTAALQAVLADHAVILDRLPPVEDPPTV